MNFIDSTNVLFNLFQDAFVLLDLIGAPNPQFLDLFESTSRFYQNFQEIGNYFYFLSSSIALTAFFILLLHSICTQCCYVFRPKMD